MHRRGVRVALGAVVIGAAPCARVAAIHQGFGIRAALVVAVAVGAAAALEALHGRRGPGPVPTAWLVVPVAAVAGAAAGGRIVGLWLAATVALVAWTEVGRRAPLLVVAVLSANAARVALDADRLEGALVWTAVAAVAAVVLSRFPEVPDRVVAWLVAWLRRILTVVLLVPLWFVVAFLPWCFGRLVRYDPLRPPTAAATGWVPRRIEGEHPERLWFADPVLHRPRWHRVHSWLPGLLALAVLVAVVGVVRAGDDDARPLPPAAEEAVEASDETPELFRQVSADTNTAIEGIWFSQYVGNEWSDVATEHVNVVDGRRATWRSPRCTGAPHATVWMFGGSTLFGTNQRDEYTLPSTLAKLADREGIVLDVVNWGMPGDVAWQQARRLERALAAGERPDVVVFYDGWNDLRAVLDMDFTGREGVPDDFVGPMDRLQQRMLSELGGVEPGTTRRVEVPEPGPGLPADEAVALAARSYATADRTARLLAADAGVDFVHVYQPSVHTREPKLAAEPVSDPTARANVLAFRDRLPDGVVDLSGTLDGETEPRYLDEVHTIELGNAPVAAALLDELQAQTDLGGGACP